VSDDKSIIEIPTFDQLALYELRRACAHYPPHEKPIQSVRALEKFVAEYAAECRHDSAYENGERKLLLLVKIAAMSWRVAVDTGILLSHGARLDADRYG
jgi:hypothetical protein